MAKQALEQVTANRVMQDKQVAIYIYIYIYILFVETRNVKKLAYFEKKRWNKSIENFNGMVARILIKVHARNHLVTLWEGNLSHLKVYEESLSYVEGKPFDFKQSFYTAL